MKKLLFFTLISGFILVGCKSSEDDETTQNGKVTLHFEIQIKAAPEVVYRSIIDSNYFQQWTSVFSSTSHYKGTWEKGSKIQFLSIDENGNTTGLASKIRENIANKHISIEHYGFIKNGEEITESEEVRILQGSFENYALIQKGDITELHVDSDTFSENREFFHERWPKALEMLKNICESQDSN